MKGGEGKEELPQSLGHLLRGPHLDVSNLDVWGC